MCMKMSQSPLSTMKLMVNKRIKSLCDGWNSFVLRTMGKWKRKTTDWLKSSMRSSTSYYQIPSSSLSHCFAQLIKLHCGLKGTSARVEIYMYSCSGSCSFWRQEKEKSSVGLGSMVAPGLYPSNIAYITCFHRNLESVTMLLWMRLHWHRAKALVLTLRRPAFFNSQVIH